MEILTRNIAQYTVVTAKGRLDAAWADYFTDTFLTMIRNGNHHIIIESSGIEFLSSAGIRALVRINKELFVVKGSFKLVNSTEFVSKTLETTGFGNWLADSFPEDITFDPQEISAQNKTGINEHYSSGTATLRLKAIDAWPGWQMVNPGKLETISFAENVFALGIGSASPDKVSAMHELGEFMAIDGNLVYQTPGEKGRPDYQLSVNQFIPEMLVARALILRGEMDTLFRFSPTNDKLSHTLSELSAEVLSATQSTVAAFVIAAEIDGLVGASLIQSAGRITDKTTVSQANLRDWLSFSGERVYNGEQAVIFGIVSNDSSFKYSHLLRQLSSNNGLFAHVHASVFPYQPLPNGKIHLKQQIGKFFGGPPPVAMLHLIDDNRPNQYLGESSLVRGACWCSPVQIEEDTL
jgi:anti-anti-sigma factor